MVSNTLVTEVARFKHSDVVLRVAFSMDGRSIFSGGWDKKISQWEIPEDVLAAAEIDSLASAKNETARGKHNMECLLNVCDLKPFGGSTSMSFHIFLVRDSWPAPK
ncbi:hypothetical protein CY34DRAFT_415808 [Suillus luteus UH-Slu-Lm8-n1]|uniref:Uncharacterized protein n=1 Tax=Suillus luteus UH-Slu-Lm8-n1 TaxID=930992 RepID=A0A0D0A8L8_9AGAM|nr:hypothetical protein CY34DRAFT_415808 [Suillus luteus UH-Slu-Lm8-n1]